MKKISFLRSFPSFEEKDENFYLFNGVFRELSGEEVSDLLVDILDETILKRHALIKKIGESSMGWPLNVNVLIYKQVFEVIESLDNYFKKESASKILTNIWENLPKAERNKILEYFISSTYVNNRKRAYDYLRKFWNIKTLDLVRRAFNEFGDFSLATLIIEKGDSQFVWEQYEALISYFSDEDLDFREKVLRNKLFAKVIDKIPGKIKDLKKEDPISYIFIMKEARRDIDLEWAVDFYLKEKRAYRFLPRWYAEMGMWEKILSKNLFRV